MVAVRSTAPRASQRAFFAVALLALGCSGEQQARRSERAPLFQEEGEQASLSPARWRYHPRQAARLAARLPTSQGALYAGAHGERWLVGKTGRVQAASSLAPEDLIAISRRGAAFLFIGESGTSYEAESPLGPLLRASAPFEALSQVSASGLTLVGVKRDGGLARSADGGASWQPVGPAGVRFVDVALASSGTALGVAVPEALWRSTDGAATWRPLPMDSFGANEIRALPSGELSIGGVLGTRRLEAGRSGASGGIGSGELELGAAPARGPDAGALREGRAALIDGRYLELVRLPGSAREYQLWEGPFEGELRARSFPAARGCELVRLAGYGRVLYLACARHSPSAASLPLDLLRSDDGGKAWKPETYPVVGRASELVMAVGEGGALVVSGVCPSHARQAGCKASGIHYRRATGASRFELSPAAAPALRDAALGLAFAPDGRRVSALARRTKNGALALFVSHDAGRTFVARELERPTGRVVEDEGDDDDDDPDAPLQNPARGELDQFGVGEDGTSSIVLRRFGALQLVLADDEGRVLSSVSPPADANALGASGTRALAISSRTRQVWESLDGGTTWTPAGTLPFEFCPSDERCATPVRCEPSGCVIGDEWSRIGWRGAFEPTLPPTRAVRRAGFVLERKLGVALSCSLSPSGWRRLPGVTVAPSAEQAAIGQAAWFATAPDAEHAGAAVYHGYGGPKPRVEPVTLLPGARDGTKYAFAFSRQIEGAAALRYVVPEATPGETHLRKLELAWDNLIEGKITKAELGDAGAYSPGDYERAGSGAQAAAPSLLSIASGGLYLRVHKLAAEREPTLFFDGKRVATLPPVRWPGISGKDPHAELLHIGAAHVPVLFVGDGAALVRARAAGDGWVFDALATGFADPDSFELDQESNLVYLGGRAALQVMVSGADRAQTSARVFPIRADGAVTEPPIAVPTQLDLGPQPQRCGAPELRDTPRVVAPFEPGTRHPLIVSDSREPQRVFLSQRAVLYGTPAAPCAAAYDAELAQMDGQNPTVPERAIVLLGDLEHAWIFRVSAEARSSGSELEYRLMSCRFDASAEIPKELYRFEGTSAVEEP